jgi:prefoldin subunit 5
MARGKANRRWVIGKPILVPLTTSLYVPGTLADPENVIVDVGTGFYVEKVGSLLFFCRA